MIKTKSLAEVFNKDRHIKKKYFTCPMRSLEGERLFKYFQPEGQDIIFIGSCVVTKQVEQQVIATIRETSGKIVVFGCISKHIQCEIDKKENPEVFKTTELNNFFENGAEKLLGIENTTPCYTIETNSLCNRQYEDIAKQHYSIFHRKFYKSTPMPFLVVAQGCNNQCTYCHTKFYVGKVKSKPISDLRTEYLTLIKEGNNFINIIAEDIGAYGVDINSDLPQLLSELDSITETAKTTWMLDGLQPMWYLKQKQRLIPFIRKNRIFALSIPVQSGSDRIIKLMNRDYECKKAIACLKEFRSLNPKLCLQGIFIVGFPSESENDFNDTLNFIKEVKFNDVTLIPYSEFSMCESSKIGRKISEDIINKRIDLATTFLKPLRIKVRR
jgi:tRNA A37 methylthiotransferase MiaB